jgi:hypothetical protein
MFTYLNPNDVFQHYGTYLSIASTRKNLALRSQLAIY